MRSTRLELDCVSIHHSHLTIHVMSTDEELMIARHTVMPLAAHSGRAPLSPVGATPANPAARAGSPYASRPYRVICSEAGLPLSKTLISI
jgi:hypothetical protein